MELAAVLFLMSWLTILASWARFLIAMKKSQAIADAHREDVAKQLRDLSAKVDEGAAFQEQVLKQGEETIALLNAIKGNLEHRSIKN